MKRSLSALPVIAGTAVAFRPVSGRGLLFEEDTASVSFLLSEVCTSEDTVSVPFSETAGAVTAGSVTVSAAEVSGVVCSVISGAVSAEAVVSVDFTEAVYLSANSV